MERAIAGAALILGVALAPAAAAQDARKCMRVSGSEAGKCVKKFVAEVGACRRAGDGACETALRASDGPLDALRAGVEAPIGLQCTAEVVTPLGYTSPEDVVLRASEACLDFAEDALDAAYASDLEVAPGEDAERCRRRVAKGLEALRRKTARQFGPRCQLREISGRECNREKRDERIARKRSVVGGKIRNACGAAFDELGLSSLDPAATTLDERIDELLDRTVTRARHFAQLVYPPNDLGPDADFGPFPVGVSTLELEDEGRLSVPGDGPRPVRVEVYYPSTPEAVAGQDGDVVSVFGIPIVETPAVRDAAIAPGPFPLVVFSHGNGGIRFQSFYFAAHLASHGYVVVSPDHHGNTFVDALAGIVDADAATNRPLDMSFLIDQFTAFDVEAGNFFEGAIDEDAVGASGHSFGGYTTWALAGPEFSLGTFTDPRVKAILPQAPASSFFTDEFFAAITIPTLVFGGSIDETTPFESNQQAAWDALPSGAAVVGLAKLVDAGHFTFSDFCEVPREVLAVLGGFSEACEPRHLPWRHAHDIANYLSLNFFDAILKGDADDLAKLTPAALAEIEDLEYQSK